MRVSLSLTHQAIIMSVSLLNPTVYNYACLSLLNPSVYNYARLPP